VAGGGWLRGRSDSHIPRAAASQQPEGGTQERAIPGRSPTSLLSGTGFPDLASIRAKLRKWTNTISTTLEAFRRNMDRVIRYKSFAGDEFSNPLCRACIS